MQLNYTFLEENQIFGNSQLDIFTKYGTKCTITDYAILKGIYVSSCNYLNDKKILKNRTGYWWTKSTIFNHAVAVNFDGNKCLDIVNFKNSGARPILSYSSIKEIASNKIREKNGLLKVDCG